MTELAFYFGSVTFAALSLICSVLFATKPSLKISSRFLLLCAFGGFLFALGYVVLLVFQRLSPTLVTLESPISDLKAIVNLGLWIMVLMSSLVLVHQMKESKDE